MKETHRQKRVTRRRRAIVIGCLCTGAAIALIIVAANMKLNWFAHTTPNTQIGSRESEPARTASVIIESDGQKCEFMIFNNDTGRTGEGSGRCADSIPLDAHGVPVPTGTIHRLDAISKSFYGAGR